MHESVSPNPNAAPLPPQIPEGNFAALHAAGLGDEVKLESGESTGIDLTASSPMAVDGQYVLVGSVRMAHEKGINLWSVLDEKGNIATGAVMVADDIMRPNTDLRKPEWRGKFMMVNAGTGEPVKIGRNYHESIAKLGPMPGDVSRQHLALSLDEKGVLKIDDTNSSYKTTVLAPPSKPKTQTPESSHLDDTLPRAEVGRLAAGLAINQVSPEAAKPARAEKELLSFDPHASIGEDPNYLAVATPFNKRGREINDAFMAAKAKIDDERRMLPYGSYEESEALDARERDLNAELRRARKENDDAMEAAIKPYLAERLKHYHSDTLAGYQKPGEVVDEGARGLRSRRGKQINAGFIKYGQLLKPGRFTSWAGSNGQKHNGYKNITTSSSAHIVNLAAAMLSGNMDEETEPIVIERDTFAEEDLPSKLRGRVPLYKVRLGMHRLAAQRMIYGLDAPVSAEVV